jgi:hypothetical protein
MKQNGDCSKSAFSLRYVGVKSWTTEGKHVKFRVEVSHKHTNKLYVKHNLRKSSNY